MFMVLHLRKNRYKLIGVIVLNEFTWEPKKLRCRLMIRAPARSYCLKNSVVARFFLRFHFFQVLLEKFIEISLVLYFSDVLLMKWNLEPLKRWEVFWFPDSWVSCVIKLWMFNRHLFCYILLSFKWKLCLLQLWSNLF
jgi:hypothetical protein